MAVVLNYNQTSSLTQYNSPIDKINFKIQTSFSELWVEIFNDKDLAIYQIQAVKKFYLV